MKKTMFREYDIRGRVSGDELNKESVELIAKACGTILRRKYSQDTALVGYDSRKCSPDFRDAVVCGLNAVGVSTVDIGMVATPVFYFGQYLLGVKCGLMITGSHNPDGWSGIKIANGYSSTFLDDEIQQVYQLAINKDFEQGMGQSFRFDGIKESYIASLKFRVKPGRRLRVVIDAGNGIAGTFGPALFRAAGFAVSELFCELDPCFPNHFPDPSKLDTLRELRERVVTENADIGIAFDGDGDRLGVVDDKGHIVSSDRVLMLLARHILEKRKGAKVVFDVKCSSLLNDDIIQRDGIPIMWKTGYSFIKDKMKEEGAAIGGEHSGHIFIQDNFYGFDDAMYAGICLAGYLSSQNIPLSELLNQCNQYFSSPNIQVFCPDDLKYEVVNKITKDFQVAYGSENVITLSGARVNISDGWGLIRPSSNLPALVVMMEATTQDTYLTIKKILKEILQKYPEVGAHWENDSDPF